MGRSYRYGGTPTPGGYHYGFGGLGVLGSEVPPDLGDGPSLQFDDITLPAEADDEFRVVLLTQPIGGTLFVYEDSTFEFSAPDGSYTFSYAGYKNGVMYGTATVSITIGYGLGGNLVLHDFLLTGDLIGVDTPRATIGRRIGPRVGLRANGELIVLF